eukprot:COSAG05_NODE_2135_length_3501_cov_6.025573_1_plen_73_part_00
MADLQDSSAEKCQARVPALLLSIVERYRPASETQQAPETDTAKSSRGWQASKPTKARAESVIGTARASSSDR